LAFLRLALGEDFRLGDRCRGRRRHRCHFLRHRRSHGRDRLTWVVHDPDAGGRPELGHRQHVADHERADVGVDPLGNRRRQARDGQFVEHEVQDALLLFHARGFTDGAHGHLHGDRAVRGHFLQIDVQEQIGDGIELQITDNGHPRTVAVLTVEPEREQLSRTFVAVDHAKHRFGIHGDRLGLLSVVEDRRDGALAAQALGESLAASLSPLDRQLLHRGHD
jgi:hypothetical protein